MKASEEKGENINTEKTVRTAATLLTHEIEKHF